MLYVVLFCKLKPYSILSTSELSSAGTVCCFTFSGLLKEKENNYNIIISFAARNKF